MIALFGYYRCTYKAPLLADVDLMLVTDYRLQNRWVLSATSKKAIVASVAEEAPKEANGTKKTRTSQATRRGRKKATTELQDDDSKLQSSGSVSEPDVSDLEASISYSEKPKRRTRKKGILLGYLVYHVICFIFK